MQHNTKQIKQHKQYFNHIKSNNNNKDAIITYNESSTLIVFATW